jgi:hypothetical protein
VIFIHGDIYRIKLSKQFIATTAYEAQECGLSRMRAGPHRQRIPPTDGQWAGRKRWCGECGDESEQERSRTGGGAAKAT